MRKLLPIILSVVAAIAMACGSAQPVPEPTAEPTTVPASAAQSSTEATPTATPAQSDSASAPAAPPPSAQAVPESAPDVPQGGEFRRLWSDPPSLDPHLTGDTTSAAIVVELYGGLVMFDTDLSLVPDIAESWQISEDGTVYTFKLRPYAKFHDGKPVTAHDFKWSLERAASPGTASQTADTYLGDIVGVREMLRDEASEISGVTVIDDQTLQITIDAPKPYFLAKMTYPSAYVLDRENIEAGGSSWTESPNGTGPFKLREYRIGERIVLEKNENFHLTPANVDTIFMNLAGGQAMAMYENDEIDITGVGLFDLDRILDPNEPLNQELVIVPPDFNITYIGFNPSEPPFDDANFRKALNHSVDKELIATEIFSGLVVPAYGILPPGLPGYNPDIEGLRFDPELAQQLMNESRYSDPASRPRIVITTPGTGGSIGTDLEVVLEMWRQILNVEVEIQQSEWATFLQDLNSKQFQAFAGLAWQADYPDPQDFLDILFHSESQTNHGQYSNLELDAILEQARTEPDIFRRLELYHQAEEMIVEDAAWLPLWYAGDRHVLIKSRVKDYRITPMTIPKLRHIYIGE